ncbi:hypothetical protein K7432_000443 [Basidiobolus ranarum]|uniref:Uncharacterized protein n=1 Tax=Basidiobolus ranarum TaxID=34480 RepID=A0ABR2X4I4_9FUNG
MGILENIRRLENIREKICKLRTDYIKLSLSSSSSKNIPPIHDNSASTTNSSAQKQMAVKSIPKIDLDQPKGDISSTAITQSHSAHRENIKHDLEDTMSDDDSQGSINQHDSLKATRTKNKLNSKSNGTNNSKNHMVTVSLPSKSLITRKGKTESKPTANNGMDKPVIIQKKTTQTPPAKAHPRFFARKSTQTSIPLELRSSTTPQEQPKDLSKDSNDIITISDSDEEMFNVERNSDEVIQEIASGTSTPEPQNIDNCKMTESYTAARPKSNPPGPKNSKVREYISSTNSEAEIEDIKESNWKDPEVVIPFYHHPTKASHYIRTPVNEVVIEIDASNSSDTSRTKTTRKRKNLDSGRGLVDSTASKRPTKASSQILQKQSIEVQPSTTTIVPRVIIPERKKLLQKHKDKEVIASVLERTVLTPHGDDGSKSHIPKDVNSEPFKIDNEEPLFPNTLELDISLRPEFTDCPTKGYSYIQDKRKHTTPQLLDTTQFDDRQLLCFLNTYAQICRQKLSINAHESSLVHIDRPYMSLKAREKLSTRKLPSIQTGDVVHYPFTAMEKDILLTNISLGWNKISKLLPGRKPNDCKRFHDDWKSAQLRDELIEPLIYIQTIARTRCKKETTPRKTLNNLVRQREIGSSIVRSSYDEPLVRGMGLITSFSSSSGAVIDTCLHQSTKTLLGVACVTNDDPTYNKPNNLLLGDVDSALIRCLNQHYTNQANRRHYSTVTDVKFSSDGKCMYSSSFDTTAKIWSTESGELKDSTVVHSKRINRMAVPKNKYHELFATGSDDGLIGVYPVNTELGLLTAKVNVLSQRKSFRIVSDVDFCNGRFDHLLVGAYEGTRTSAAGMIIVWDYQTSKRVHQFTDMLSSVSCIQSSPTGNLIVSGSSGGTYVEEAQPSGDRCVRVFDLRTNLQAQIVNTNQSDINLVTFSPDETFITSSGTENRTFVYDRRFCDAPVHVLSHEEPTGGIRHDGVISLQWVGPNMLLTGGGDSLVKLWNITRSDPCIHSLDNQDSPVSSLSITPDHDVLAVGTISGSVYLYSNDYAHRSRQHQWTVLGDE